MHGAQPFTIQDAVSNPGLGGIATQIEIIAAEFYNRHPAALPKNEVIVKNCKAVSLVGRPR
jgi:hypothetical protein